MIIGILLSIAITLGAGLTGDFNECPTPDQPAVVQQS